MKSFETKAREKQVIEFELDGVVFKFTPPKRAGLIMSVVGNIGLDKSSSDTDSVRDLLDWLGEGLSDEQGELIWERLKDPDDDLDLDQVNEIARYVLGQSSNRPTRRRSG